MVPAGKLPPGIELPGVTLPLPKPGAEPLGPTGKLPLPGADGKVVVGAGPMVPPGASVPGPSRG